MRGTTFDRALRAARTDPHHVFVFGWNRGLGDIALGLLPLFARIRAECPGSRIVVFTRPELEEAFMLAGADALHVVGSLQRGVTIDVEAAARSVGIVPGRHLTMFADPDPTRWLEGRRREHPPVLHWRSRWNAKASDLFSPPERAIVIGAHVDSETARYYGYVKDWPAASWRELMHRFPPDSNVHWVLFGHAATAEFDVPNATDLRGRTTFLEMLAVIRTRCRVLVAPDSGVLTAAYYLDQDFPLDIVSLWSDPRQGILKQACASPNPSLHHVALQGPGEDVRNLAVDDVAPAIEAALHRARWQVPERARATAR
jgi:ADP-heptose:LPS heptosyltransferase